MSASVRADTALAAIIAFAATNIDDFCLLIVFFARSSTESKAITRSREADAADRPFERRHVVSGQALGFTVICSLSLLGIVFGLFIPAGYVELIGFLPLLMGLYKLFELCQEKWGWFRCCESRTADSSCDAAVGSSTVVDKDGAAGDSSVIVMPNNVRSGVDDPPMPLVSPGFEIEMAELDDGSHGADLDHTGAGLDHTGVVVDHADAMEMQFSSSQPQDGKRSAFTVAGPSSHRDGESAELHVKSIHVASVERVQLTPDADTRVEAEHPGLLKQCPSHNAELPVEPSSNAAGGDPVHAHQGADGEDDDAEESSCLSRNAVRLFHSCLSPHTLQVMAITIANGGDNIGIYLPLFATATGAEIVITLVLFYVLLLVWCVCAYAMVQCPVVADQLSKYGAYIVPFLLMGLGLYVLWGSVTITG